MSTVEILIADDHELVRKGLISILTQSHPEWRVVGDVANGEAAIELGTALRPDVAILDLTMPDLSGLEAAERLLRIGPRDPYCHPHDARGCADPAAVAESGGKRVPRQE